MLFICYLYVIIGYVLKIKWETKNTTLSKQFQNPIEKNWFVHNSCHIEEKTTLFVFL